MEKKKQLQKLTVAAVLVLFAVLFACGIIEGKNLIYFKKNRGDLGPLSRTDIQYLIVEAPESSSNDGTINAYDWSEAFPEITATMGANKENSYVVDYLAQDPYLVNIYEGYGFSKDYGSARGHEYTLEDVSKTQRPHAKANCLTCKTPNFAKLVNDQGIGVYSAPFDEVFTMMEENISCYTCHGNDAGNQGTLVVTHSYVNTALGDNVNTIDPSTLSCGQCHIEYYFTPSDSETMMPYHDIDGMSPDRILSYYNEIGFYDWIQESTGAKMLKAQHPEMETFLSGKHSALLNCADCHMPIEHAEDGSVYFSHTLLSPLENESLLLRCATCHGDTDMTTMVHRLQDRVTMKETEVGNRLSDFKNSLAEAVSNGNLNEEDLNTIRNTYREAQWYFDFCYVENSEGAHNSELSFYCLEKSDALITEGMNILER